MWDQSVQVGLEDLARGVGGLRIEETDHARDARIVDQQVDVTALRGCRRGGSGIGDIEAHRLDTGRSRRSGWRTPA